MVSVLLEYIKYGECSIRVITSMVSVLLEYIKYGECSIRVYQVW